MMNYLIQEGSTNNPIQFIMNIAKRSKKHEEALMTIASSLKQEGIQEGKKQASIEIARQMLKEGMDRQSVMKFTNITEKELSQLANQEVH